MSTQFKRLTTGRIDTGRRLRRLIQRRFCLAQLLLMIVLVVPTGQVYAQGLLGLSGDQKEEKTKEEVLSPAGIAERLAAAEAEIVTTQQLAAGTDEAAIIQAAQVGQELEKIRETISQQATIAALLQGDATDIDNTLSELPVDDSPSLEALNNLYEVNMTFEAEPQQLAAAREQLENSKKQFETAEKERRKARGELEKIPEGSNRELAQRALRLHQLASRLAEEDVNLRTLEVHAIQAGMEQPSGVEEISARIKAMRSRLVQGTGDASSALDALTKQEAALLRLHESTERRLASADLRLQARQNYFTKQAKPSPILLEEIELLTARRDAVRREIALIDAQLERIGDQREVWTRWLLVIRNGGDHEQLKSWHTEAGERYANLEQAKLQRQGRVIDLERRRAALEQRIAEMPAEETILVSAARNHSDELGRLLDALQDEILQIAADQRLTKRLQAEINDRTSRFSPVRLLAMGIGAIKSVVSYEITTVDDEPITVGSLALALALFGISLWASRRGADVVGRVASNRFKLDAGASQTLQSLSFYLLLVGFMLMALRAVHFPLTAFTVLGGAIAIGIGFGSQNVMNNFISGLILMLERPVRVADVIEVDNNHGIIEKIGARSTQIRSTDGRHIVVPNSFFLESNVVNWTLSDELIRTKVTVGVNYGSPTRLVEQLIRQVVTATKGVLQNPEPIIVFQDFGDSSLNFDVHFWVTARSPMQVQTVASEIRFSIDDLFREHDIVIAFPQLDVHIDSPAPFKVKHVNDDPKADEPGKS